LVPHSGAENRQSNRANMIQGAIWKDKKYKIKHFSIIILKLFYLKITCPQVVSFELYPIFTSRFKLHKKYLLITLGQERKNEPLRS